MNKVISVHLNGNAYQIDENGYARLLAYLNHAEAQLAGNADKGEIMADLEQAIAEKCTRFLGSTKTVMLASEIEEILKAMGPVDVAHGDESNKSTAAASSPADGKGDKREEPAMKRLYQLREGAMISGLCNGIAAYTGVDVKIIRILAVALAVVSHGLFAFVYVALMFVIPFANTSEEHAAAQGLPFNAQELVNRAMQNYGEFKGRKHLRRQWREQRRAWRQGWRREFVWSSQTAQQTAAQAPPIAYIVARPIAGVLGIALTLTLVFSIISLSTKGVIFGWALPASIPLWVGIVGLVLLYRAAAAPLAFAHHGWTRPAHPWAFFGGLAQAILTIGLFWWAFEHFALVREYAKQVPALAEQFAQWLRDVLH